MADTQQVRDTSQPTQANLASQFAAADSFLAGWCEQRRYEIKEVIGRGSYGVVCAAVDKVTKERVAIKKIQNVFDNVADATRILREIKLLKLLKHPGTGTRTPQQEGGAQHPAVQAKQGLCVCVSAQRG